MTDYSFILRKMSADGQGYFSEEDRLRLLNAADRIAELEAALNDAADTLERASNFTGRSIYGDAMRAARAALGEKE